MRPAQSGFILVSALAVLALLTSLVAGVLLLVRSAAADASLARDDLRRDAMTHAGLEIAAYQLFSLKRSPSDIVEQRLRLDAGTVTLSVEAENGKIDLNGADAEMLAGLWRLFGSSGMLPKAFAARVIDWRDKDNDRSPSGAEHDDYAAAGLEGAPPNGPFGVIDDLQHVLGVDARQVRALKPFITVNNPTGKLSAITAPRETLRLLPGITPAQVDRILSMRQTAGASIDQTISALLGQAAKDVRTDFGEAFTVRIAVGADTRKTPAEFIVVRSRDEARLYFVTDYAPAS